MPKRRDGHEGWSRRYAEAYDRVFPERVVRPDACPPDCPIKHCDKETTP